MAMFRPVGRFHMFAVCIGMFMIVMVSMNQIVSQFWELLVASSILPPSIKISNASSLHIMVNSSYFASKYGYFQTVQGLSSRVKEKRGEARQKILADREREMMSLKEQVKDMEAEQGLENRSGLFPQDFTTKSNLGLSPAWSSSYEHSLRALPTCNTTTDLKGHWMTVKTGIFTTPWFSHGCLAPECNSSCLVTDKILAKCVFHSPHSLLLTLSLESRRAMLRIKAQEYLNGGFPIFRATGCNLPFQFTRTEIIANLQRRTIVFAGDSVMGQAYARFTDLLSEIMGVKQHESPTYVGMSEVAISPLVGKTITKQNLIRLRKHPHLSYPGTIYGKQTYQYVGESSERSVCMSFPEEIIVCWISCAKVTWSPNRDLAWAFNASVSVGGLREHDFIIGTLGAHFNDFPKGESLKRAAMRLAEALKRKNKGPQFFYLESLPQMNGNADGNADGIFRKGKCCRPWGSVLPDTFQWRNDIVLSQFSKARVQIPVIKVARSIAGLNGTDFGQGTWDEKDAHGYGSCRAERTKHCITDATHYFMAGASSTHICRMVLSTLLLYPVDMHSTMSTQHRVQNLQNWMSVKNPSK